MLSPGLLSQRISLLALIAVVAGSPFAVSVPWLKIHQWFSGPIENPGFLTAPVDNQSWFVIFGSITAALTALVFWRGKSTQKPLYQNPVVAAALIWFTITLARAMLAPQFMSIRQELLLQASFVILFIIAAMQRATLRGLVMFQLVLSAMTIPLSIIALMQNAGVDPLPYSPLAPGTMDLVRGKHLISSTFGHPNFMGSYLTPAAILSAGLAFSRLAWPIKAMAALSAILCLLAMVAGGTRGPLLAATAGAAVFILMGGLGSMTRRRIWIAAGITAACLAVTTGLILSGLTYDLTDRLFAGKEVASRAFYWLVGLEMFQGSPLFGVGAGQFDNRFWWAVANMPEVEPGGRWHFMLKSVIRGIRPGNMHNDHLQVLVESGLLGALAWACLWAATARRAIVLKRTVPVIVNVNAAFAAAFAALCVDALFGFPFHLPCSGALFWAALGLWAGYQPVSPDRALP